MSCSNIWYFYKSRYCCGVTWQDITFVRASKWVKSRGAQIQAPGYRGNCIFYFGT